MYGYQEQIICDNSPQIIYNKSRQLGVSDIYAFKQLLEAIAGHQTLVISPAERQSLNFINYAKDHYYKMLPELAGSPCVKNSYNYMEFEKGGYIWSLPNSPDTIRSLSVPAKGTIIFDEFAFFDDATKVWEAVYPMTSRGAKVRIISTPNGEGNQWADMWAKPEERGFKPILINWRECSDMTPERIATIRKALDALSFRQEYENEILGSKLSYFPVDVIKWCTDKSIKLWNFPEQLSEGTILKFGMDVGRKIDKSSIVGINAQGQVKYKQTFERTTFEDQEECVKKLLPYASMFRIDKNGIGEELSERMYKINPAVVVPTAITNEVKVRGFIALRMMMDAKPQYSQISLPDDFELERALNMVQRIQSGAEVTFDAPRTDVSGHSDTAFALMLAVYGPRHVPLAVSGQNPPEVPKPGTIAFTLKNFKKLS